MKFPGKVGNGPLTKWLNFGGDPDPGKTCIGGGIQNTLSHASSCLLLRAAD